jgi:hypothetical protein
MSIHAFWSGLSTNRSRGAIFMGGNMSLVVPDYKLHKFIIGGRELYFRTYRGLNQHLERLNKLGWVYLDKANDKLSRRKILSVYQLDNKNVSFRANRDGKDKVCKLIKLKVLN